VDAGLIGQPSGWREPVLLYEQSAGAATSALPKGSYRRHEPEKSVLYQVVQEHLESLLADARRRTEHGFGYPRFVEQTFRSYLDCSRPELGFARVRCRDCGFERLLAFSCKKRGLCPSCEARRMADSASHLVDRVLPVAPYRQWVLTLPIPARLQLLREPALVSAVLRILLRRIFAWQRRIARGMGIKDGRCAAVTFIQRGGGALNVNPHFHSVVPDGVFDVRPDGSVRFVPVLAPTDDEVQAICGQVAARVVRLLQPDDDGLCDDTDDAALDQTLPLALPPGPTAIPKADWEHPVKQRQRCAHIDGFSLHAQTAVHALDRAGLARLCRYGLRSPFALSRLSLRDDGRLSYRLKRPWPDGRTELSLTPLELLRRLAHLIPPARCHLVRYHGAFAPASPIRGKIRPRVLREPCCPTSNPGLSVDEQDDLPRPLKAPANAQAASTLTAAVAVLALAPLDLSQVEPSSMLALVGQPPDEKDLLFVRQRRLDWASLLRRVFNEDVLRCPRCDGKMVVLAAINDPSVVKKILDHLGLPTAGPTCAPARAPPETEFDFIDVEPDEDEILDDDLALDIDSDFMD